MTRPTRTVFVASSVRYFLMLHVLTQFTIFAWHFLVTWVLKDKNALTQPPWYVMQSDFDISSLLMFMAFVVHFYRCCHNPNIINLFLLLFILNLFSSIHVFYVSSTLFKLFDNSCLLASGLCCKAVLIPMIICKAM